MSLRRRRQLVDLARKYDALVITDDVYDMLHWPVSPTSSNPSLPHALLPRLTDIDLSLPPHPSDPQRFHNTVSNGSFSKILAPGCRTGWAYSSPSFSFALSQAGSSRSGGCASQVTACAIALMLQNGSLQRHVKEVLVPGYQSRFRAMMRVLEEVLVPLGVRVPALHGSLTGADSRIGSVAGGYFIWFELPAGVGAKEVAARAREEENLIVANGELFEVFGDEEAVDLGRWMRVCFAWEDTERLVEGIERLGRVVQRLLSEDKVVREEKKGKDVRDNLPGSGTY
jgi:DNA-binding transcriptional MocR family regulator